MAYINIKIMEKNGKGSVQYISISNKEAKVVVIKIREILESWNGMIWRSTFQIWSKQVSKSMSKKAKQDSSTCHGTMIKYKAISSKNKIKFNYLRLAYSYSVFQITFHFFLCYLFVLKSFTVCPFKPINFSQMVPIFNQHFLSAYFNFVFQFLDDIYNKINNTIKPNIFTSFCLELSVVSSKLIFTI